MKIKAGRPIKFNRPTILFEGILAATPEQIFRIAKEWCVSLDANYGYGIKANQFGNTIDICAPMEDDLTGETLLLNAAEVRTHVNLQGTFVTVSFWDWEQNGEVWANINGFACIPHAREIFEHLVTGLQRMIPLINTNTKVEMSPKTYKLCRPINKGNVMGFYGRFADYAEGDEKRPFYHFVTTQESLNFGRAHITFGMNGDAGDIVISTDNGYLHLKAFARDDLIPLLTNEWTSLYIWLVQNGWLPEIERERGEVVFNTTSYSLSLDCTYKELVELVERKFPESILEEKGDTFEIRLPSKEFVEWAERTFPGIKLETVVSSFLTSFIQFKKLSCNPLKLEGTHYWLLDSSQDKVRDFIALVNNYFGRAEKPQADLKTMPEKKQIFQVAHEQGGTITKSLNEQGQTTIGGTINPGYQELQTEGGGYAIVPEGSGFVPAATYDKVTFGQAEKPKTPERGGSIDVWFDYYHAMKKAGYKMTFKMLGDESGYSKNTFKVEHGRYKSERGIDLPKD